MQTAVVVGNFDGVHLGHIHLFKTLKEEALKRGLKPLAITFEPHPAEILKKGKDFCRITTLDEKRELIKNAFGFDVEVLTFSEEFSQISPELFIRDYLVGRFNAELIVVGYDWHFGRGAKGDFETVKRVCSELGCEAVKVEPYRLGGKVVSSSLIRGLLREARLKEASIYLGRLYWIKRRREKGLGIASELGFPTVNLGGVENLCLPNGVYSVSVEGLPAIAYLGYAPTIKKLSERVLEVHLLDDGFEEKEEVRVVFLSYIREEMVFKTAEELAERVKKDIEKAKELFLIS